jgi:heptaprenylglyceryl phosphate synthase
LPPTESVDLFCTSTACPRDYHSVLNLHNQRNCWHKPQLTKLFQVSSHALRHTAAAYITATRGSTGNIVTSVRTCTTNGNKITCSALRQHRFCTFGNVYSCENSQRG